MADGDEIIETGRPCSRCLSIRTTYYKDMGGICHDCGLYYGGEIIWLVESPLEI